MKKIYSFVLMAVALLIGTNAWATVHTAGSANELEAAWKAAQSGDVIQLTSSFSIDKTLWLGTTTMADANLVSIELNLNGQTLTSTATKVFVITHGALKVTGTGTIHHNISDYYAYDSNHNREKDKDTGEDKISSSYEAFRVLGSTYKDVDSKTAAENQLYSHLTIDENVRIISINGIAVDYNAGSAVCTSSNSWAIGNTAYPTWGNLKTKVYTNSGYGVAHGVRIDVKGYIEAVKYAVTAKGNLGIQTKDTTLYGTTVAYKAHRTSTTNDYKIERRDDNNFSPYFHIYSTAELITKQFTSKASIAVYGGGFARWYIEGKCVGSTGLYAKSGEVQLKDAEIASNFDGEKTQTTTDRGSGVAAGGSGIVIESSTNYSGGTGVSVTGDTKVTATSGYAIEETITAATGETKVSSIEITGGTLEAGDAGAISITQGTAGKNDTIVSVTGGNIGVNATDSVGNKSLSEYLAGSTNSHITYVTVEDPETHAKSTTMVISDGPAPLSSNKVSDQEANATVKWEGPLFVKDTIKTGALVLKELQINDTLSDGTARVQSLVINDGATLQVERVILGQKAQIIVEAGAKFIVTGTKGIVAPVTDNIVLRNEEGKHSIFLFNPAVTSNKHPNATYEILSYSWRESSAVAQSEVFGIPTYNAIKKVACLDAGKHGYLQVYGQNGTWENIAFTDANPFPYEKLNKPFAAYALTAYRKQNQDKLTFQFGGELVGNTDATLTATMKWSFFANSYTAEVDLAQFLAGLKTTASSVDEYIYLSHVSGNDYWYWEAIGVEEVEDGDATKLQPMQGFLLNNNGMHVESNPIVYKSMVYAPAVPGYAGAPRRSAVANNTAKLYVVVTNEAGAYDNVKLRETENVKSAEKFMNSDVNIYATAEEKNAIMAVEDLANTYLGFSTVNGGKFTISFEKVAGREFDIIDLETGARVAVADGFEYEFTTAANYTNDYRFKVVERAEIPTAIENTEAVKSAKGIYTITGQYVGEMNVWSTLPAGVYVVNGEKRVK